VRFQDYFIIDNYLFKGKAKYSQSGDCKMKAKFAAKMMVKKGRVRVEIIGNEETLRINTEHLSPVIVRKIKCGIQFYQADFNIKKYLLCVDFC
jgi:hypothetical protein